MRLRVWFFLFSCWPIWSHALLDPRPAAPYMDQTWRKHFFLGCCLWDGGMSFCDQPSGQVVCDSGALSTCFCEGRSLPFSRSVAPRANSSTVRESHRALRSHMSSGHH